MACVLVEYGMADGMGVLLRRAGKQEHRRTVRRAGCVVGRRDWIF
jgi:hypothetical protein